MFASVFILIVSVVMLLYWFRYTCLLILTDARVRDHRQNVADANGLSFLNTRAVLAGSPDMAQSAYDELQRSLDRDYRLVTYLLQHAASFGPESASFQRWLLRVYYRTLSVCYGVGRHISRPVARFALMEMSTVIGHLANAMGERSAVTA